MANTNIHYYSFVHEQYRAIGPTNGRRPYYVDDCSRQNPKFYPHTPWLSETPLPDCLVALCEKVMRRKGEKAVPLDLIVMELEDLVATYYSKVLYLNQRENWVLDRVLMRLNVSKYTIFKTYINLLKGHNSNNKQYSIQIIASIASLLLKWVSQNDKELILLAKQGLWNNSWRYLTNEINNIRSSGLLNPGDPLGDDLEKSSQILQTVNDSMRQL